MAARMSQPTTFGRRQSLTQPSSFAPVLDPGALSPEAEAFRQQLGAQRASASSDFGAWRRSQGPRRAFAWFLGLALMAPGLICFALDAPWVVSGGLELLGLATNAWLRRERRLHIASIARWDEGQAGL